MGFHLNEEALISLPTLSFLITQKKKDAIVLLNGKRRAAAIYMMGYAIEIALKKRICSILGFSGFPEHQFELNQQVAGIRQNAHNLQPVSFPGIREIRNHNLEKLLTYSGKEFSVKSICLEEWVLVASWNPDHRYIRRNISQKQALDFIHSVQVILNQIV